MHAIYAELCMVGNLNADFQQSPLVWSFWNFHSIVQIKQRKIKKNLRQKFQKKKYFSIEIAYVKCLAVNLIFG